MRQPPRPPLLHRRLPPFPLLQKNPKSQPQPLPCSYHNLKLIARIKSTTKPARPPLPRHVRILIREKPSVPRRPRPKSTARRSALGRTRMVTWILTRAKRNAHPHHLRKKKAKRKRRNPRGRRAGQMPTRKARRRPLDLIPRLLLWVVYMSISSAYADMYAGRWRLPCICIGVFALRGCKRPQSLWLFVNPHQEFYDCNHDYSYNANHGLKCYPRFDHHTHPPQLSAEDSAELTSATRCESNAC